MLQSLSSSTPSVSVVITSYNGREDTIACLRSLARTSRARYRVLVMDDASTDGTEAAVRAEFPHVRVVRNDRNLGYIPTLNRGVHLARESDYILLLNNDVTVADDMIAGLVQAAESDRRIALCGPQMYYDSAPSVIWAAGGRISPWTWRSSHHHQGLTRDGGPHAKDVDYIPAAAMLVRARVFDQIGLFEPAYEAYFEEVDFCFRLRQAGYRVTYVPTARVWHKVSRTMRRVYDRCALKFLGVRNRRWCMRRHAPTMRRPLLHTIDALVTAMQFAWNFAFVSPRAAASVFRGYCAGWRRMPRPPHNGA